MPATLTVRDESLGGGAVSELTLELLTERITTRELIRSRVYQEVQDYNHLPQGRCRGLIEPTEAERLLNGSRQKGPQLLDWRPQYEKALRAFAAGRFLILVGETQVESLDEEITFRPGTFISFVRLTPLAGG